MSNDRAINISEPIPFACTQMEVVSCNHCGAVFAIVHHLALQNASGARDQMTEIQGMLLGDHVSPKFHAHPQCYDLYSKWPTNPRGISRHEPRPRRPATIAYQPTLKGVRAASHAH
jgi:hypothetical protein